MAVLVTGGAGFIGSAMVRHLVAEDDEEVINYDKLTYAANLKNLGAAQQSPRHHLVEGDIADGDKLLEVLSRFQPRAVLHLAAESHVDRSIADADAFLDTNVGGTYRLLQACHHYWQGLSSTRAGQFRFLHVSTDEVFGSLKEGDHAFTETSTYAPNSPYAASKAAADHLVRAWHRTYGLPVLQAHACNNFGPGQFPEKLIPTVIYAALDGKPIPVYGRGAQRRDWIYVADHVAALLQILQHGQIGEAYNIGGVGDITNLALVRQICTILDRQQPQSTSYLEQISFVRDRPGHDFRYAVNMDKLAALGWQPRHSLRSGLQSTVDWYRANREWWGDASAK